MHDKGIKHSLRQINVVWKFSKTATLSSLCRALRQKPTHFNFHLAIKVPVLKFYAIIIAALKIQKNNKKNDSIFSWGLVWKARNWKFVIKSRTYVHQKSFHRRVCFDSVEAWNNVCCLLQSWVWVFLLNSHFK